jgi:hypothetical protein
MRKLFGEDRRLVIRSVFFVFASLTDGPWVRRARTENQGQERSKLSRTTDTYSQVSIQTGFVMERGDGICHCNTNEARDAALAPALL